MGLLDQRPKLLGIFKDSEVASEGLDVVTVNSKWADLVSSVEQRDIHICVGMRCLPLFRMLSLSERMCYNALFI